MFFYNFHWYFHKLFYFYETEGVKKSNLGSNHSYFEFKLKTQFVILTSELYCPQNH